MKTILTNIVLSGAGAGFVMLILTRLVPNEMLEKTFFRLGKSISTFGRGRLGTTFWEKLEQFLENSINVCWENLKRGWNSDESKS